MRITTDMIFNRTMFNLARNIERYMGVQQQLSTGRQINTPSDDPIGTQHDLNYRTRLNKIEQYLSNISMGVSRFSTYENGLADLKDLYSSAKEIAITMANDAHSDEVTREAAAHEIESLLEQVLGIANAKSDNRYLYAGHRTRTEPLEISANGAVYRGDTGLIEIEVDDASRVISNLIGQDVFLKPLKTLGEKADLEVGVIDSTLLEDLNLGNGVDLSAGTFEVYDRNRDMVYTIDISGATSVGEAVDLINAQLGPGSNLSVGIAESGASLIWEPKVPETDSIFMDTPLENLNAGDGVDKEPGTFIIRNADSSIELEVDISGADNIQNVLTVINTTLLMNGISGVTAGFNADHTGLALTDGSVPPRGLSIEESGPDQSTAADLGILGELDPHLEGEDITPKTDFVIRDISDQTTAADLGLTGEISMTTVGESIRPRITADTLLSSLNNKAGFEMGEIKISQGSQVALIDLNRADIVTVGDLMTAINDCGLEINAVINEGETGISIETTATDKSLIIESNDSRKTAHNLGIAGASDMIGSLILLTTALRENDHELIDQMNNNMDLAMKELLSVRADVGAKTIRLETTQNRLENSEVNFTRLLSEVEDADIVSLVSQLAREENLYQASLVASSKLLQQSLVDFLR